MNLRGRSETAHLEVAGLGGPHALVERVLARLAEQVPDLRREDLPPNEGQVVKEEDGGEPGAVAKTARAEVERVEECHEDVVCIVLGQLGCARRRKGWAD